MLSLSSKSENICFCNACQGPRLVAAAGLGASTSSQGTSSCDACLQTLLSHALLCCQHFSAQCVPLRSTSLAISSLYSTPLTCNTTTAHFFLVEMSSHSAQGNCSRQYKSKLQLLLKQTSAMTLCGIHRCNAYLLGCPNIVDSTHRCHGKCHEQPKARVQSVGVVNNRKISLSVHCREA